MVPDDSSTFETLKDLVSHGRTRDGQALDVRRRPAPYSYHELCTNVWKAGNLFTHYGVHAVGDLAVAVGPKTDGSLQSETGRIDAAEPLLAVLGGAIVGATANLTPREPIDAPVLVAPAHWKLESTPGCTQFAYGGPPTDPSVSHFERDLWSENPVEPPETVDPSQEVLRIDDETWTHEDVLAVTATLVDEYDISATSRVQLNARITEPGGFVAGILAPLSTGATIVVPENETGDSEIDSEDATLVVTATAGGDEVVAACEVISANEVTQLLRDTRRV